MVVNVKKLLCLFCAIFSFSQLSATDISWGAPETLSTAMVNASDPRIVMDLNGNSTAAWVEGGVVKASFQPVGGSWGTVETLSGSGSSIPRLSVDANGNVRAVWLEGTVVMTALLPFNGSWGSATTLSDSGASSPVIAMNAGGDVAVVWARSGFIESKTLPSGGAWSLVSILSSANADHPSVAIGTNGKIVAVWHRISGVSNIVESSSQMIGGAWGLAVNILPAPSAFSHDYPKVSVDANGNADVIWLRYQVTGAQYSNVFVYAASLPSASTSWSFPLQISDTVAINPANLIQKIRHDQFGNAIAFWTTSYDGSTYTIQASVKQVSGSWAPFSPLAVSLYSFDVDFNVNTLNDSVATFMYFDGTSSIIQAAELNSAAFGTNVFFTPPVAVSTGPDNSTPKVATTYVGGNVYATAAWLSSDGSTISLQVSTGSRITVDPPSNVAVIQNADDFGVFVDYNNVISWEASTDPDIIQYVVLRNGSPFFLTDGSTLQVIDHNAVQNGSVTYGVLAVDSEFSVSPTVTVSFP